MAQGTRQRLSSVDFFPTGVVGSSELRRCAGLRFHMKNNRFNNFTLHDYITHRLHDYTTTILRLLSSLYIYIYIGSSLLSPIFSNPISYPLLPLSGRSPLSFISSFLSLLVARCSLLSTLCSPLSPLLLFGLPVAPRCSLLSAIYSLITPSFLSRRFR